MKLESVLYEKSEDIGIITLNRPKALNAINAELVDELAVVVDHISKDSEVRAVIITGGEKAFAAGGDISYMVNINPLQAEEFLENIRSVFDKIESLDKAVIAGLSGLALGGGCELALTCDIRIAAEGTIIGQPEINLGIIPGAGGTQRLSRIVGPGWAKYLVMSGSQIDADTAFKIGLVTAIVPKDQLMEEAKKLAKTLAFKAPLALKAAKKCINLGMNVDLPTALSYEMKTWSGLFATEDQTEGMKAFLEKRKPVYQNR